jgi:hypothetical protein
MVVMAIGIMVLALLVFSLTTPASGDPRNE